VIGGDVGKIVEVFAHLGVFFFLITSSEQKAQVSFFDHLSSVCYLLHF
jgi:hypothetical protein